MRPLCARQLAGAVAALALGACSGPAELSLGATTPGSSMAVFLSPTGSDASSGSSEHPRKTFAGALAGLSSGATITLRDGIYDSGSGYLDARCADPGNAAFRLTEITIKAEHPRAAFLAGNGSTPPLSLADCSGWTIEDLHVEGRSDARAPDTPDAGSLVVVGPNSQGVVLRHLLATSPNAYKHAHVIHIADGSTGVRVEECELYDFHHNGIETTRATGTVLVRNYINGRGETGHGNKDVPGAYVSDDADGADYGVLLEESKDTLVENTVVEGVHDGFGVVARDPRPGSPTLPAATGPLGNNRLLGNVVLKPQGSGVRIESRCQDMNPCTAWESKVVDTALRDNVVVGASVGLSSSGAINTQVRQLSVVNSANGVFFNKEPKNVGVQSTSSTVDSLVAGFQGVAFKALGEADWSFNYCAASGGNGPIYLFQPDDGHVTSRVTAAPDLGGCLVSLPPASALNTAGTGGGRVGASVVAAYEDGILGTKPLWDPATGVFLGCQAVVMMVNDDRDKPSCTGVSARLNVAPSGAPAGPRACPLPP